MKYLKYLLLILLFAGCQTRKECLLDEISLNIEMRTYYTRNLLVSTALLQSAQSRNDTIGIKIYTDTVDFFMRQIAANDRRYDSLLKTVK